MRRVYSARDRTRLKLTLRGKRLGLTLSEIRTLLDLYDSPTGTTAQLKAFVETIAAHREVLERQREDLDTTLVELTAYEEHGRALLAAGADKRRRAASRKRRDLRTQAPTNYDVSRRFLMNRTHGPHRLNHHERHQRY